MLLLLSTNKLQQKVCIARTTSVQKKSLLATNKLLKKLLHCYVHVPTHDCDVCTEFIQIVYRLTGQNTESTTY